MIECEGGRRRGMAALGGGATSRKVVAAKGGRRQAILPFYLSFLFFCVFTIVVSHFCLAMGR